MGINNDRQNSLTKVLNHVKLKLQGPLNKIFNPKVILN